MPTEPYVEVGYWDDGYTEFDGAGTPAPQMVDFLIDARRTGRR